MIPIQYYKLLLNFGSSEVIVVALSVLERLPAPPPGRTGDRLTSGDELRQWHAAVDDGRRGRRQARHERRARYGRRRGKQVAEEQPLPVVQTARQRIAHVVRIEQVLLGQDTFLLLLLLQQVRGH